MIGTSWVIFSQFRRRFDSVGGLKGCVNSSQRSWRPLRRMPCTGKGVPLRTAVFIALAFSLLLCGCGEREVRGRITGKVTFEGQAVPEGLVLFSNTEKGINMTSIIKSDGSYEVVTPKGNGLPTGTYKVSVCPPRAKLITGEPPPKIKQCANIPAKYRDCKTAGLSLTVQEGENPFNIEMKR